MKDPSHITRETVEWNGIAIEVTYDGKFLGPCEDPSNDLAHLEIRSVAPERAPLPISNTGYKSHWPQPGDVNAYGGPIPYVLAWIAQEEQSSDWKEIEKARRQLSLF